MLRKCEWTRLTKKRYKELGSAQEGVTVRIWQRVKETGGLNTEEGD